MPVQGRSPITRLTTSPHDYQVNTAGYILQLIRFGLDANLPTPGAPPRIYYATDTKKLYFDDGSAWHFVTLT